MENINVQPQDLPAFLDPLLDFLAERLPPSLFDAIYILLSYGLLLISAAFSFVTSLPSWKPWEWDAQKILPPIISILAAYYAILSVYRTTGWFMRMTFRLMEWGVILGLVGTGLGWYMGANGGLGGLFGAEQDRPAAYERQGRAHRDRPRAWEPFAAHNQWQYDERQARAEEEEEGILPILERYAREAFGGNMYGLAGTAAQFLQNLANNAPEGQDAYREQGARRRRNPHRRARDNRRR